MTDKIYPYIPDLPYVVTNGIAMVARFTNPEVAHEFCDSRFYKNDYKVIDTTPKPRVLEDAQFITWKHTYDDSRWYAEKLSNGEWLNDSGTIYESVEDLPGVTPETVFTVLEERKS